jgi:hypothetical protein
MGYKNPKEHPEVFRRNSLAYYYRNKEARNAYAKQWREKMRRDILTYYSNKTLTCACCGETEYTFLTIDHINNGGMKERREFKGGGHQFYRRIIKNKFPVGYQVLCYNCNCGRAKTPDKKCPHESKKD